MSNDQINEKPPALAIVGATGLKHVGGRLDEELHKELRGTKAVKVYRQMADSAICGSAAYVFDTFARGAEWAVEPSQHPRARGSSEAVAIAERLHGAINDMETSWSETVGEMMTMVIFGWSWLEMTWKICRGPTSSDPLFKSQFNDGLIAFRDWPIRAQESLDYWEFDDAGRVLGMHQLPPPDYRPRYIPLSKSLLLRTRSHKGNPEGRSLYRTAYRNWYFMTREEEFEAIGLEKETAGMHVMEVPFDVWNNPEQASALAMWRDFVSKLRQDAYGGVVVPTATDSEGNPTGFKLSRLSASGRNLADTDTPIRRHANYILMAMALAWMQMGDGVNGSRALAETLTSMASKGLNGLLGVIDGVVTRDAFSQFMALNGLDPVLTPRLVHKDIEELDITQVVDAMTKLSGAGLWVSTDKDRAWMREKLGAPAEEEAEPEALDTAQRAPATPTAPAAPPPAPAV